MRSLLLVTERLVLRDLSVFDAEAVFGYRSLPEIARYQAWEPGSAGDVARLIQEGLAAVPDLPGTWFQLGICRKEDGALIGDCGLRFPSEQKDRNQVELGITLAPEGQSRGYAIEALTAVIEYLFGDLGKHRVFGSVDPRNEPSMKLMAKLGFRQEARFKKSLYLKGEWVDDAVFSLVEDDWPLTKG